MRIVLLTVDGGGTNGIMRATAKSKTCFLRWRERFAEEGVEGLLREKIRPSRIPALKREVALTLNDPPPRDATRWTGAMMPRPPASASALCSAFGRRTGWHRMRQFKLSTHPPFVDRLRDVVGLCVDPPAHAIVLSVDLKLRSKALDRTQSGQRSRWAVLAP